jgi:hypothetical protein
MHWDELKDGHLFEIEDTQVDSDRLHYLCIKTDDGGYYDVEWFMPGENKWHVSTMTTKGVFSNLVNYYNLVTDHGKVLDKTSFEDVDFYRHTLREI